METGGRTTREQRSDVRDDSTGTGGQWDNPMSKGTQGKWEHQDSTGGPGGDTYSPQHLGQSGGQTGTGPVGVDIPTDRYPTSGQYGGQERVTTSQTAGYADPTRDIAGGGGRRSEDDDDEYGAAVGPGGGPKGKPSMTSKVKGATEKMTSKIMGDPGKQARGREREEGTI